MITANVKNESVPIKRKSLFYKITECLLRIKRKKYEIEIEELGEVHEKANLIKFDLNELESLFHRLALAESKVEIYERNLSDLLDLSIQLIDLELTPSKAGKKRNELAFVLAWDIYDCYYEEFKKYPSAVELSLRTSAKLSELTGEEIMNSKGKYLLPESTARDYKRYFKKIIDGN